MFNIGLRKRPVTALANDQLIARQIQHRNNLVINRFSTNAQISASFIASPTVSIPARKATGTSAVCAVEDRHFALFIRLNIVTIRTFSGSLSRRSSAASEAGHGSQTGRNARRYQRKASL